MRIQVKWAKLSIPGREHKVSAEKTLNFSFIQQLQAEHAEGRKERSNKYQSQTHTYSEKSPPRMTSAGKS